jgi:Tfp pilus assembly protein FimV
MRRWAGWWGGALVVALLLAACRGGGDKEPSPQAGRISLTDPRAVPTAEPWSQPPPVRYLESGPLEESSTPTPIAEEGGTAPQECGDVYVVRPGDTLGSIAARCQVDLQKLIDANPDIQDPSRIFPGQRIRIPR